jgi:penicillin-binding protein 1A
MLELGYIDQAEHDLAAAAPDNAFYHGASTEISAPYLAEMVRAKMVETLGREAYTGGYVVYTTVDSTRQTAARDAVRAGLETYDRRHGYRGPEARVDLGEASGPADWNAALAPYRSLAGLVPALVTEADEELALVYLENGQTVALGLEQVTWARAFVSRNQRGAAPQAVNEVLQTGDVIRVRLQDDGQWMLGQLPDAEAALVSLDPRHGAIRALVGGYDFTRSKFNRVTQSRRQPGSSFKPFIYSAALDRGYTTASIINDAPIVFEDDELERTWKPQNFSEKFFGPTRLREAMVNSRNLVSIRLLQSIGVPYAREYVSRFGFDSADLPANLSMALGTADLPPLSMARAYAVFANGGHLVEPHYIERVEDSNGNILFQAQPARVCEDCEREEESPLPSDAVGEGSSEPLYRPLAISEETEPASGPRAFSWNQGPALAPRVISEQNAYLVRSMMMDVIRRGTGKKAMELGRKDLAGKTGTTNEQRDAWFSGYNDELVTTVWVGFDSHEPLGRAEVGGRAALPIWIEFMGQALEGVPEQVPPMPPGLVRARIDPDTGLLAALDRPGGIMEVFQAGRLPEMEQAREGVSRDAAQEEDPYDIY